MKFTITTCLIFAFCVFGFSQRYIEKAIQVQSKQGHYLNSQSGKLSGGNSQLVFEVDLPPNTIRWFYSFTAFRSKQTIAKTQNTLDLISQLTKIIDQSGTTAFALDKLNVAPGSDHCNVYLLSGSNDAVKFEKEFSLKSFNYVKKFSNPGLKYGKEVIQNYPRLLKGRQFIGIENPSLVYGISIELEVVAITVVEEENNTGFLKSDLDHFFGVGLKILNYIFVADDEYKMKVNSCFVDELTSKYTYNELETLADYKLAEIILESIGNCADKIDENYTGTESKFVEDKDLESEIIPTFTKMIGDFKSENCDFKLNIDKSIEISWHNSDKVTNGKWDFDDGFLVCNYDNSTYKYLIVSFKPRFMKYRAMDKTQTIYWYSSKKCVLKNCDSSFPHFHDPVLAP